MIERAFTPAFSLALVALLCACGDAPQKMTRGEAGGRAERAQAIQGELPPGHPPLDGSGSAQAGPAMAGVVELAGELAKLTDFSIYLVGYDRARGSMALVSKYQRSDFRSLESGELELRFRLDQAHPTNSGQPLEVDLDVYIDVDGMVETKDDILARVRVPATAGDQKVRVRLDDSSRTQAPAPAPSADR